uniref:Periplasmic binding protein-like II superfamily n=1 Tax=Paulinella chromatophora TaxID=39717 RepID=B1X5D9_PAUCH|nr:hypothetical protein PCC_0743 [Paulinella chromatophora]ACB43158.1 hypothetical protein PCC_0743 [Paulinella chromatophora]
MSKPLLSRRGFLNAGTLGSLAFLESCRHSNPHRSTLAYLNGDLPLAWLKVLPNDWKTISVAGPQELINQFPIIHPDLVQFSDAWAQVLGPNELRPLEAHNLLEQLAPFAKPIARLFSKNINEELALPIAFSPWLLVVRNRTDLVARASEGWNLLLDPTLRGKVILPSSPRVVIDIAQRLQGGLDSLPLLRRSVLSFDQIYGINLLVNGDADVAILPARQVIPLLREDPALRAFLPNQGTLLSWNTLVRPATSQKPLPSDWIQAAWKRPLLKRLLSRGWVPPLPRISLMRAFKSLEMSDEWVELMYPTESLLKSCSTLIPINDSERKHLQQIWDETMQ